MTENTLTRRDVIAGSIAIGVATLAPDQKWSTPRPEFVAMHQRLGETLVVFEKAKARRLAAQPRIRAEMRASSSKMKAFSSAPEIRDLNLARMDARAAAESVFFSRAQNSAEAAMQREARHIFASVLS
ncbi:hypothetical protein W911_03720 [Hyphomicrobium nitrativorans NL23]|uniref:Uncharacterized protein n=1 Tax=Hyphomicrobium nitrativorans NL23 TaxID=1029756 RepID=V5SGC1_9HYPH|nr:hypothetical protein [Hyphomicrobium nitrativorans]AHB49911.1 hypothetical protein W911_03720 [Hyphomicrobium nitrativorans NL23]